MKNYDAVDDPEDVPTKAYTDNLIAVTGTEPVGSEIWLDLNSSGGGEGAPLDKGTADSLYVNTTGDIMQGNLALDNTGFLTMNAPVVANQNIEFTVGDILRWTLGRTNAAEGGADAGSNFSLASWSDVGGFLKSVLMFNRQTGLGTVAGDPTAPLGIATRQYVDAKVLHGTRNRIINGDFSVNQRGFTSGTTNAIGPDRWWLNTTGGTSTQSVVGVALGELPESAKQFWRINTTGQSAAGDYCTGFQRIESVRTLSGKTVTVSFWAKCATAPKIAVELEQVFGTGGTPSTVVQTYAGQVTLATGWARYSVTVGLPSITGKTLGTAGDDYLRVVLWISGGSSFNSRNGSLGIQTAQVDIWGVQVEEGPYASPYEHKPYLDELRACQRYFCRFPDSATTGRYVAAGHAISTVAGRYVIYYPSQMRIGPAMTVTGAVGDFSSTNGAGSAVACTAAVSVINTNARHMVAGSTVASGLTAGQGSFLLVTPSTAFLDFSAEL